MKLITKMHDTESIISFMSVRREQIGSHWTDFDEILIWDFLGNLSRKYKIHWTPTKITDTLHEDFFTFMTIYRRMRNVSKKFCRENQNTFYVQ